MQARANEIVLEFSSILNPLLSKELMAAKVLVEGAVVGAEKPSTVSPMTELLKLPSTRRVSLANTEQLPVKSTKAEQVRAPAVK